MGSLKVKIITVGKTKKKHWQLAEAEFIKRLQGYVQLDLVEVKEAPLHSLKNAELAKGAEAREIVAKLQQKEFTVALHREGKQLTSVGLSKFFQEKMLRAVNQITFLIGGPVGLDAEIVQRADLTLSLSKMTLPHELAKVVLLEQIYRAFTILGGEKYHK